jgi:hypothetical protein
MSDLPYLCGSCDMNKIPEVCNECKEFISWVSTKNREAANAYKNLLKNKNDNK